MHLLKLWNCKIKKNVTLKFLEWASEPWSCTGFRGRFSPFLAELLLTHKRLTSPEILFHGATSLLEKQTLRKVWSTAHVAACAAQTRLESLLSVTAALVQPHTHFPTRLLVCSDTMLASVSEVASSWLVYFFPGDFCGCSDQNFSAISFLLLYCSFLPSLHWWQGNAKTFQRANCSPRLFCSLDINVWSQ